MSEDQHYDVVIVGAGIAGSIVAKSLSNRGKRVLILEGGTAQGYSWLGYQDFLKTFYETEVKTPNAPYPQNSNAPQPLATVDIYPHPEERFPWADGYWVQQGPLPFGSTYTRTTGGTTLHWLGTCLRMLPADFKLHDHHGVGLNWPISYEELMPYYILAEHEIGVSGDVESQQIHGLHFEPGYVYPMYKIPQSFLDMYISECFEANEAFVEFDNGELFRLRVQSTPQGRNGMPNPKYKDFTGEEFEPVGAVGNPVMGLRCDGNSNCVPICPIQAKYNALKTLNAVDKDRTHFRAQAVASQVLFEENGHITGIEYKAYADANSSEYSVHVARGTIYVLAASAIENAKLLLASGIESSSGLVGKNLLDHPSMITWGLLPERIGSYRGPGATSGIPAFRNGAFRSEHAAFRIEIGNWGWSWPHADPFTSLGEIVDNQRNPFFTPFGAKSLIDLVEKKPLYGSDLRQFVKDTMGRQFRLAFEFEQLAQTSNYITIDRAYKDRLGNYRPVIHYNLTPYDKAAMAAAKRVSDKIFETLDVNDFTHFDPAAPGYVEYEGQGYVWAGAGHVGGTHIMGATASRSVVNPRQQSWDHENLYLVGSGNFPTLATSNPTLTIAALSFWAADNILEDLDR